MLLFRSKEDVQAWCAQRDMPVGAMLTVAQVWKLSQLWYGDRLSPDFNGRSVAEAHQIFASLDLTGPFWRFDAPAES